MRFARLICTMAALLAVCSTAAAEQMPFEDVVRNLRNPDPKVRVSALRLLRDAKYPEAAAPIAPLITDPIDEIQLEAIAAELSFVMTDDVPRKSRVAFVVELRSDTHAPKAFEMGPLATWPKKVPSEVVKGLLQAIDDESSRVRLEAIYGLGVVGRGPLGEAETAQLIKALDHYDPAVRAGAARVIGRLRVTAAGGALLKSMNDSGAQVRFASMRALGEIGDERAVQALTDQFNFYQKGEGAWSALDALARIAHPSSIPLFKANLANRDPHFRRAAAEGLGRLRDASEIPSLQTAANNDESEMVRAANAFALQKIGQNYIGRLVDFLDSDRMALQIQGYFLELGPSVAAAVLPRLQEPDESTRRHLAVVLGAVGDESTVAALTPLASDGDKQVAKAAAQAVERIRMRRALSAS